MTILERCAHEAFVGLQDIGFVHDGVSGNAKDIRAEAESVIQDMMVRYLTDVTTDANEAEYGR